MLPIIQRKSPPDYGVKKSNADAEPTPVKFLGVQGAMKQDNLPGWESPLGLNEAEKIVRRFGPLPPMLVAGIKSYEAAPVVRLTKDPAELAKFTREALGFTVKVVPTLKSAFFFAAEELKRDDLRRLDNLTWSSLLALFTADEIAGICASAYIYNLIKQVVPDDAVDNINSWLSTSVRLSLYVSKSFDKASSGRVLLHAALKILGIASLAAADPQLFSRMRKKLDREALPYDLSEEESRWGFNHMQVASGWARACGFGPISRLVWAPDNSPIFFSPIHAAIKDCSEDLTTYRGVMHCASSLQCTGKLPDGFKPVNAAELEDEAAAIIQQPKEIWLLRRKSELSEDIRQALDIRLLSEDLEEGSNA